MRKTAIHGAFLVIWVIMLGLSLPEPVNAQSLASLHIGDPASNLTHLGPAAETGSYLGMEVEKWILPNGNELSATVNSNRRIVFLESDFDGKSNDPSCDLPGLKFGVTTLAQLRKRLGSNGFGFQNRPGVVPTEDGVILVNSYEIGKTIVTFYTKAHPQVHLQVKASDPNFSPADYSKLDAISLADPSYAKNAGWGDKIYDPQYKKAEWK